MRGILTVVYATGMWAGATIGAASFGATDIQAVIIGLVSTAIVFMATSFGYRARRDHTEVRQ